MDELADPVEDGGEEEESLKGGFGFLVAGGEAPVSFDSAEEVFDPVPLSVVAGVERGAGFGTLPFRDGGGVSGLREEVAECAAVVSLVGDDDALFEPLHEVGRGGYIVEVSGGDDEFDGPSAEVDQGVDLGVSAAAAGSNALAVSESHRGGAVLVDAHVGTVDEAQFALGPLRGLAEELCPETLTAVFAEAPVDGLPGAETSREVSPGVASAQDVKDAFEDLPQLAGAPAKANPTSGTRGSTVNFLRPLQTLSDMPRKYFRLMEKTNIPTTLYKP